MKIRHKHAFRSDKRAAQAAAPAIPSPDPIQARLQDAMALHRAGQLSEAEALYRQLLAADPNQLDALYLLSVVACQAGRFAEALDLTNQTLALNPGIAEAHANRGNALNGLAQFSAALESFDQAIRLKPEFAAAHSDRSSALRHLGRLQEAVASCDLALRLNPQFAEAWCNRANALIAFQQYPAAVESCDQAIRLNPQFAEAWCNRGSALCGVGHYQAAIESCDQAIRLRSVYPEAWNYRGGALIALGQPAAALECFDKAILFRPDYAEAHNNRGNALYAQRQYPAALASFDHALLLKPDFAEALNNRGNALYGLKQFQAALESLDQALRLKPDFAEAHSNRGNALYGFEQYEAALESFDRAILLKPDLVEAHSNRGNALYRLKHYAAALESCDTAIRLNPNHAPAYRLRGNVFYQLKQHPAALENFDRSILLDPDNAETYANRGAVLGQLEQHQAALESCDHALRLDPDSVEAHSNRAMALHGMQQYAAALASFENALRLRPAIDFLAGMRLHMKRFLCDWDGIEDLSRAVEEQVERGEKTAYPFEIVALRDSPALQRKAAEIYARHEFPAPTLPPPPRRPPRDRIRIGYFSADFHNHATSYLMAELFERHDRSRFEIYGFSFGPSVQDAMRTRVAAAMDRFEDVRPLPDLAVTQLSRELEIDIAVDLKGFTRDARGGIFSERAAPLQVSYLGYPGTMGAEFIDYLIADPTLIPAESRQHYSEKIAYLPDSYQVNDSRRAISAAPVTRAAQGLPEHAFVFCCFNINWKIGPATFDRWMRLLAQIEGSVLWLLEDNPWVAANLRKEAVRRGIAPERLVFAGRLPLAEHLARHRLADLFLDTLPYNAHTTASDALWTGLPVLTLRGESFASRVGASLLNAIDLPELVTTTADDYEALALSLARNPGQLRALRDKLQRHRLTTPLFDTPRFARHLEAAYTAMVDRYHQGLPPDHILIP